MSRLFRFLFSAEKPVPWGSLLLLSAVFLGTFLPVLYYPASEFPMGGNELLQACFYRYYLGLLLCAVCFISVVLWCRKKQIAVLIHPKALCCLYGTAIAWFVCLSYHAKGLPMLADSVLVITSGVCLSAFLSKKILWAAGVLLSVPLIFIFMVDTPQTALSPDVMIEILATSWKDAQPYFNLPNICMAAGLLFLAVLLLFFLHRSLRAAKRPTLLATGILHALLFLIAIQPLQYRKAIATPYVWPIGSLSTLCDSITQANGVIRNIKAFTQTSSLLPKPKETSPLISKGDGVIVIIHIGESVRADHLSLNGYHKNTTPFLRQQERLINFRDCMSAYPATDRSQLILLTDINDIDPSGRFCGKSGSLMDYFAAGDFTCASFWSMGMFTDCGIYALMKEQALFFSRFADKVYETEGKPMAQLSDIHAFLNAHEGQNAFLLINNYGSHVPYDHYNEENPPFAPAKPATPPDIKHGEEQMVQNAYDSTIHYTDEYIHRLITSLKGRPFIYLYVSDHGEYLGDDGGLWGRGSVLKGRFHSTKGALVPFFIITSPEFEALSPHFAQALETLNKNKDKRVSHAHFFHTVLGLFDIKPDVYDRRYDLTQPDCLPYMGEWPDTPTAAPAK